MSNFDEKVRNIKSLAEGAYLTWVIPAVNYARFMLKAGGTYSLVLIPIFEMINAALYWRKIQRPGFTDSRLKITLNHTFNAFKIFASAVGISLAIAGMIQYGFGIIIAAGCLNSAKYIAKAIRSGREGDRAKVANNFHKATVGLMISAGFTFITFFHSLAWVGGMIVLGAAAHIILMSATALIKGENKPLSLPGFDYSPLPSPPTQKRSRSNSSVDTFLSFSIPEIKNELPSSSVEKNRPKFNQ